MASNRTTDRVLKSLLELAKDLDDGEGEDEGAGPSGRQASDARAPPSYRPPFESNDIHEIIAHDALTHGEPQVPMKTLLYRELGLRAMSPSMCAAYVNRYVPNAVTELIQRPSSSSFERGHGRRASDKVFCGRFNKEGSVFMRACQGGHILLYEYSNQKFKLFKDITVENLGWSVIDTVYSPDQRCVAYSTWSTPVQLCNVHGEQLQVDNIDFRPSTDTYCMFSLAFSPDSAELLAGCSDSSVYIYDFQANKRTLKVSGHRDDVNSVCWLGESNALFVSGSDDSLCKLWDRRLLDESRKTPVSVFVGHFDGLTHVSSKGDERYFVTNSKDQSAKLWDTRVSATGNLPVSRRSEAWAAGRGLVRTIGQHPLDHSVMTYRGHSVQQTLIRCYFSPVSTGQRYIYSGSSDGAVYIYEVLASEPIYELDMRWGGHSDVVRDVSWHPWDGTLVSSSWDRTCRVWRWREDGCCGVRLLDKGPERAGMDGDDHDDDDSDDDDDDDDNDIVFVVDDDDDDDHDAHGL